MSDVFGDPFEMYQCAVSILRIFSQVTSDIDNIVMLVTKMSIYVTKIQQMASFMSLNFKTGTSRDLNRT